MGGLEKTEQRLERIAELLKEEPVLLGRSFALVDKLPESFFDCWDRLRQHDNRIAEKAFVEESMKALLASEHQHTSPALYSGSSAAADTRDFSHVRFYSTTMRDAFGLR